MGFIQRLLSKIQQLRETRMCGRYVGFEMFIIYVSFLFVMYIIAVYFATFYKVHQFILFSSILADSLK